NIHDVPLALRYADRIVGLRKGKVVYDGAPAGLDAAALTEIYGEEDWNAPAQAPDAAAADEDLASAPPLAPAAMGAQAETRLRESLA
ncbi:MAG: hypothetical protein ACTJGZ_15970, partial [Kerstersia sp.]